MKHSLRDLQGSRLKMQLFHLLKTCGMVKDTLQAVGVRTLRYFFFNREDFNSFPTPTLFLTLLGKKHEKTRISLSVSAI